MTDEELLARGDEKSMNVLLGRYREALVRFCNKFVHNDARAEEMAQEVMLKVFLYKGRFEADKPFRAWLWTMARRTCQNEYRRRTYHPEEVRQSPLFDVHHDGRQTPEQIAEHDDMLALLHQSIEKLPECHRATLALVIHDNMTHKEVAEVMGVTRKGISMRMAAAKELLREMMVSDEDASS